jgi:hypothetical protein
VIELKIYQKEEEEKGRRGEKSSTRGVNLRSHEWARVASDKTRLAARCAEQLGYSAGLQIFPRLRRRIAA